jgi:hypothetical protein
MNKKKIYRWGMPFLVFPFVFSLSYFSMLQADEHTEYVEEDEQVDVIYEEDVWFGPGFYYGIWFDEEDDYWVWREKHKDYPPNRDYYSHDHPVYYHPEDHENEKKEDDHSSHEEDHAKEGDGGHRGK